MINPLFSVIVPVYNVELFIVKCLDSLLSQSFNNYEVIIVNDGSTDKSLKICNSYKSRFPNITIIDQFNKGVSFSRNRAMQRAIGDYIWFVDADDYIEKNALEVLATHILEQNIDMLGFSNYHLFEKEDRLIKNKVNNCTTVCTPKEFFEKGNVFETAPWIMVIKTSLIKNNGIKFDENLVIYEDNLFMMSCLLYSKSIKYIDNFLYYYLIRENSLTAKNKSKVIRITGYLKLVNFSLKAVRTSDFKFYWHDVIYNQYNSIYKIFFEMDTVESKKYKADIKSLRKNKLKICAKDICGIKIMKILHNYCFFLYKMKLLNK